jgi:hypothetical protein
VSSVDVLRLYDAARRPPNWTDIIRPGQFAAFAKDLVTGRPCDQDGQPFARVEDATVLVFESIDSANSFCEDRVRTAPSIVFDIFDADGRTQPPLLTIVNSSRAESLDESPGRLRRRGCLAYGLLCASVALFAYQYWADTEGVFILPMFLGINLVMAAGRLLLMNLGAKGAERRRQERLPRARSREWEGVQRPTASSAGPDDKGTTAARSAASRVSRAARAATSPRDTRPPAAPTP